MGEEFEIEYYPRLEDKEVTETIKFITENKEKWDYPFFTDTKSYLDMVKIKEIINRLNPEKIQNIIILGTGGSIQTFLALKHLSKKNIYPITSSRSIELISCLERTKPENSIVIPISRGGETLDVNSTIGTFVKRGYRFLGLSSQGILNKILQNIGCPILDVPDLAGRFAASISNVAIVPAYLAGIDIDNFLRGLETGYDLVMNNEMNPSIVISTFLFNLYQNGYKLAFCMPYSKYLEGLVGLFVQEISESTGKDGKGLMGAYQPAPLSQHSVLEYLLGGKKGVVIPFIWTVKKELLDMKLDSSIEHINSQTAQSIVNYQADATFEALIEQAVPSVKILLESPNAYGIGKTIAFIQSTIYYICILMNVNWANNPKVNIGKEICNEALIHKLTNQERKDSRKRKAEIAFQRLN